MFLRSLEARPSEQYWPVNAPNGDSCEYVLAMPALALMVDVDGVLVRRPGSWHDELKADLGIDPDELDRQFFAVHFDEVLAGRAALFDRLDAILPRLGSVSSRELVDYWFQHDAMLDDRLLADLAEATERGAELHLATDQERHRARFLWESLRLCDHFIAMHYAADVGARKTEMAFYRVVESRTKLRPAQHCLVDDSERNVLTARQAGWQAFRWSPQSRLRDVLGALDL